MEKNGSLHAGRFPPTEGDLPRYLIGTVLRRQAVDKKVSVWWDDEFSVFLRDDRRVRRTTAAEDQRPVGGPGVHIFGVQKLCFGSGIGQMAVLEGLTSSDKLNKPDVCALSQIWKEKGISDGLLTVKTFTKRSTPEQEGLKRPAQAYLPSPKASLLIPTKYFP